MRFHKHVKKEPKFPMNLVWEKNPVCIDPLCCYHEPTTTCKTTWLSLKARPGAKLGSISYAPRIDFAKTLSSKKDNYELSSGWTPRLKYISRILASFCTRVSQPPLMFQTSPRHSLPLMMIKLHFSKIYSCPDVIGIRSITAEVNCCRLFLKMF